jgi:hypothetical protein
LGDADAAIAGWLNVAIQLSTGNKITDNSAVLCQSITDSPTLLPSLRRFVIVVSTPELTYIQVERLAKLFKVESTRRSKRIEESSHVKETS